jgi:2-hydroxychromene-2-carboxylate isomerase
MYHRMSETQAQWGEQQTPQDELFASFARDLGLDMNQFSADYADPATADRVAADVEDGLALGVQGTRRSSSMARSSSRAATPI